MAEIQYDDDEERRRREEEQQQSGILPSQAGQTFTASSGPNRWTRQLANDPFGGAAGEWAKRYYDADTDGGAAIQREVQSFRTRYGDAAPEDDRSVIEMIATGQRPEPKSVTESWTDSGSGGGSGAPMQTDTNKQRADEVWAKIKGLMDTTTTVTRDDPNVKVGMDAYVANQDRARRRYISEAAEKYGPLSNTQTEERLAASVMGQNTAQYEADRLLDEQLRRREDVTKGIGAASGFLDSDRAASLSEWMGGLNERLGIGGLNLRERQMGLDDDYRLRQLGLQDWDRQTYYDLLRRGLL